MQVLCSWIMNFDIQKLPVLLGTTCSGTIHWDPEWKGQAGHP